MNRVKMDSRVNGDYLAVNREKRERQAQETSVHWKGRTNACHLPGTSDVLLWGCPSADDSLYFSRRTCYDARNTECCMPGCFSYCSSYTS